jgi:hypothetical protein
MELPPQFRDAFLLANKQLVRKPPSASMLRIAEFSLDVGLMLLARRRSLNAAHVSRFSWVDSSPMCGYDWIWSQEHEIRDDKLISTFEAVLKLSNAIKLCCSHSDADATDEEGSSGGEVHDVFALRAKQRGLREGVVPNDDWKPWLLEIKNNIFEWINPPMALASGHRGLTDKCAAEAFKWYLQTPESVPLATVSEVYVCQSGDMGTEIGIPSFQATSVKSLLPPWVSMELRGLDIDDPGSSRQSIANNGGDAASLCLDGPALDSCSVSEGGLGPEMLDDDETPRADVSMGPPEEDNEDRGPDETVGFMPNAITIAALQHIINNLCADTHKSLRHWEFFFNQLKNLEAFLNIDERRARFMLTCLRHTRFSKYERTRVQDIPPVVIRKPLA